MKLKEYIRLAECAMCPHSYKEPNGELICDWFNYRKLPCKEIEHCGLWGDVRVDILELEVKG